MNVFYICHQFRYNYIKKKKVRSRFVVALGVFDGNHLRDLFDHFDDCEVTYFESLVPENDILEYFSDLNNYPYKYNKIINFLIEIERTDLVDNNPDVYLNMFGLRSIK